MARLEPMGVEAVIRGLPGFLRGMDRMGDATSRTSGLLGKIGGVASAGFKTLAVGATAAVGAIGAVSGAMIKLASDAAPIAGVRDAFVGLTSDIEGGSTAMLEGLQEASFGMTTNTDLMKSFNLAAQLVGKDFATNLPNAMQYLGKVAAATGEDMGFMMDSLIRGVGRLSPMILDNLGIQVDLTEAYEVWAKENDRTVDSMSKTEQQAAVMAQVMSKLEENTADMPDVAGTAQQSFASLGVQLQNLKDEIGLALLPVITPLLNKLGELAKDVIPIVVNWINEKFIPAVQGLVAWFGERMPEALGKARSFWSDVLQPALQSVWSFIQENILPAVQNLFAAFQEHAPVAQAAVQDFVSWFQENVVPVIQSVFEKVGSILNSLAELWREHGDEIIGILKFAFEIVVTTITNTVNLITSIIDAFLKILQGDWEGAWNSIKDFLITLLESALSIVGVELDEFVGTWTGIWENIKTIVNTIWESIVSGITNKVNEVKETITGGFDSIINSAKNKLGIRSPSKLFMGIGEDLMAGMAQGIQNALNVPELALTQATTNLVQPTGQVQAASSVSAPTVTNNQYQGDNLNLTINTSAPTEDIVADFRMLKAMGGRV